VVDVTWFAEGDRIGVRALGLDDVARGAGWFNDSAVTDQMNKGVYPNTETQQAAFFDTIHRSRHDVLLGIATRDERELIGIIGLHQIDWVHRRGDISIVIGETSARGKGYGAEAIRLMTAHAFATLNLHKLTAGMWATNLGSRRSFEKAGFVLEATLEQSYWYRDRYVDEWRLRLLVEDWRR
jgi:RimJ/RimL family protein N-acetyltransferase